MAITLYNSRTRRKESFQPADENRVTMYVCGPTVYNYAHIGNARPPVVFDLLYRLLKLNYPGVVYARNITDVDDKIMAAADTEGCPIEEITRRYADIYNSDMGALGVSRPDIEPHATEHIDEMIAMIQRLVDNQNAYAAEGHVLFDVTSFAGYGELSGRSLDEMISGARVEVAGYKRHPADFILWKPSSPEQVGWDSPWGRGRPGWHLECSAMSARHLGETIDIHGGGIDLQFPHHENERAQSECAHGKTFARYWLHNGFLTMNQDKMSKSLGNVVTVHELLEKYPGEVLRLVLLTAHYRQPLDWSEDTVADARNRLDGLYRTLESLADVEINDQELELPESIRAALEDDLNTPMALSELAALSREARQAGDPDRRRQLKAQLLGAGNTLGLMQLDPEAWFRGNSQADANTQDIDALVRAREEARRNRDFAEADRLRDELTKMGIELEDSADGTRWRYGS
jgi:cysteinyl-tRNA synthetase